MVNLTHKGIEVIKEDIVISCIKEYNGEYSLSGIAKILTGYYGFKFIPKLKKSRYYGIYKSEKTEDILSILNKLKEEEVIFEKANHKIYTSDLLDAISEEKVEYIKPEFISSKNRQVMQTEDLLSVIYDDSSDILLSENTKKIIRYIDKKENIFITGGAGTGKSYILNQLRFHYRNKLNITSTTGISALNISGQTIHSWAGIGIADKPIEDIVKSIKKKPVLLKQILLAELLAIDEISMLDAFTFDYINEVLKAVRNNSSPFGGIQLVLLGDFFQLPPVGLNSNEKVDFCFNSKSWKELNIQTVLLEKVMRQSDSDFIKALNNVREDKTDVEDLKIFFKCDYEPNFEPPRDILQIYSTNSQADAYNTRCYNEVESKPYTYISKDEYFIYDKYGDCSCVDLNSKEANILNNYDISAIDRFNEDCKAPKNLELKVGCRVMLVKNQNIKSGLVNGSCGTVTNLTNNSITVLFDNGLETNIIPEKFEYIKENRPKIRRTQYPLRLAYGITIHKSQGMTFDKLVVNFNRIFDYGQAYVALSRTRDISGLIIKGFDNNKIKANPKVVEFYRSLKCVRL